MPVEDTTASKVIFTSSREIWIAW